MNLPRVLIVSTVKGKANEIATIMGGERLSEQDHLEYYLWNIQNKYYKTQVLLCVAEDPSDAISIQGVEALLVHHNPQGEDVDQSLKHWLPLISSLGEAEVLLFSCDRIMDPVVRDKAVKWCLQRKFEFIELNTTDALDATEMDAEHNKYGVARIIEALHAHVWPNMILKEMPFDDEESNSDVNEVEEQFESIHLTQDPPIVRLDGMLDGIMGGENTDFAELFSQLMAMKQLTESLPTNQRRIAAEQLVTALWKAMGGDSSETED